MPVEGRGDPFALGLAHSFTRACSVLADGKGVPGEAQRLAWKGSLRRRVDGELPGGEVAPVCSKSNSRSGHFALDSGSPRGLQGSRH